MTTKTYQINNLDTNKSLGRVVARDESEALEMWAESMGAESFEVACREADVLPEDVEAEEVDAQTLEREEQEEKGRQIAANINTASNLDALANALKDYNNASKIAQEAACEGFSFDNLPTFGEDYINEANYDGVFSWDRTRLLYLDGPGVEIRDRDFSDVRVNGREVERLSGNLDIGTVNSIIEEMLDDDCSDTTNPNYSDPATMTHIAALAQTLNLKMTGGEDFDWLSEEEQVFQDKRDGLLILVSRNDVAWEAFADCGDDSDSDAE